MNTPPLFDIGVACVAAGRLTFLVAKDEITRPIREAVYRRSAPHGDTAELADGNVVSWRMLFDESTGSHAETYDVSTGMFFDPTSLRKPGFLGQLIECPYCMSFWISLAMCLAYLVLGSTLTFLLTPIALWGVANAFAAKVLA